MIYPPKPRPGDRVAVLSPGMGWPAVYPEVHERGLTRLVDELGLVPVEYPTTRVMGSSAADRAADLHAAFSDPTIRCVMASIGGDDQITVLRHLDADVLRADPKPFFGYSDCVNVLNLLFNAGVVGYHGGSVMVHLGRGGAMHPDTLRSLRAALFTDGWFDLTPAASWTDQYEDWRAPGQPGTERPMFQGGGWGWHNPGQMIEGPTWGGCLEIVSWILQVGRNVRPAAEYAGHVLLLETSEDMPSAADVYYTLRNMGERGLLEQFPAILVGRPKAWDRSRPDDPDQRTRYVDSQREAVLRAVAQYAPSALVVFNVDFGHTDPQAIIPYGGDIRVDGFKRTISVRY